MPAYNIDELKAVRWVPLLRIGDRLLRVKSGDASAVVELPYYAEYIGGQGGKLCLSIISGGHYIGSEVWYVRPNGCGFDDQLLLAPDGDLSEVMSRKVEPSELVRLQNSLQTLSQRVMTLESMLRRFTEPPAPTPVTMPFVPLIAPVRGVRPATAGGVVSIDPGDRIRLDTTGRVMLRPARDEEFDPGINNPVL